MGAAPRISIVVPTYNRVDRLRRVLVALAEQSVPTPDIEVIVVSDGSTDGTDEFLTGDDLPRPVVAVFQENGGPGAARNNGVQHATADLVLFVDDDVVATPTLVAEHLAAQREHPGTVVIGPMLTPPDHPMTPWVRWEQTMLYKQYDALAAGRYTATARQFYTGNACMPRRLFDDHGGFDESLRRAEDIELAYRLADDGVEFHFHRAAEAHHYAERSLDSWCDIAYQYGRNDVVFARYPGRDKLGGFLAWTFSQHKLPLRIVTWVTVSSRWLSRITVAALRIAGRGGQWVDDRTDGRMGVDKVTRSALSLIYSILYHRGMADELGGPARFKEMMRTGSVTPS
jgi:GT2 family glycosyltransferase